jgi:hypothetical protein
MSKLHLVAPHEDDKRYVRRGAKGQFIDEVAVSWSLAAALRQHAPTARTREESA